MKKFMPILFFVLAICDARADDLQMAIDATRVACSGISDALSGMKTMAGINTAVTAVGTVAGGVALGTGIAKVNVDSEVDAIEEELQAELDLLDSLAARQTKIDIIPDFDFAIDDGERSADTSDPNPDRVKELQQELDELTQRSKRLGNVRTGTMAGATATNVAGTVIAAKNRVDDSLDARIANCISATKNLSDARMQAHVSGTAAPEQLNTAENIVRACSAWAQVDLSSIDTRAKNAAISSGVGAGVGLAGTIVSAIANTDKTRSDNTSAGQDKEKNLNTAANVLAGGTTVASGVAVVFNATQIAAIKRASETADQCEGALK